VRPSHLSQLSRGRRLAVTSRCHYSGVIECAGISGPFDPRQRVQLPISGGPTMSENLDRERVALLPHDPAPGVPAELSDRDLEAVTAGKMDSPAGKQDLEARGPFS